MPRNGTRHSGVRTAGLGGLADLAGDDDVQDRLTELLPELRELLLAGLRDDRPRVGHHREAQEEESATLEQLAWVTRLRAELLTPVTDAAVAARDAAIQRAMERGTPASSLVRPSGLTAARIYQIRDGRR